MSAACHWHLVRSGQQVVQTNISKSLHATKQQVVGVVNRIQFESTDDGSLSGSCRRVDLRSVRFTGTMQRDSGTEGITVNEYLIIATAGMQRNAASNYRIFAAEHVVAASRCNDVLDH
jgi:hypothetical protein